MAAIGALGRVIPNGYQVYELFLQGESPLLMSSAECDRRSDTYITYRTLSKARAKTMEQEEQLRELEWNTRLYFDETIGPFIPGKNIKEMLRAAATKFKLGESVKRSLVIPQYRIPLIYDGPRTPKELWQEKFEYTTMVANAGAGAGRVLRCRPMFEDWSLSVEVAFDTDEIENEAFFNIVQRSQKYGLGDYRPEFGAFTPQITFLREQVADLNTDAIKPRDIVLATATKKHSKRVMATAGSNGR